MAVVKIPKKILARQHEITADFLVEIDKHLADIVEHRVEDMYEVRDLARVLHIHPTHLSNTIKLVTGKSPCYFFEKKIMEIAKGMLADPSMSIAQIARTLTFDPSNFTKFFKRFEGVTPKHFREAVVHEKCEETEMLTIKTETLTIKEHV